MPLFCLTSCLARSALGQPWVLFIYFTLDQTTDQAALQSQNLTSSMAYGTQGSPTSSSQSFQPHLSLATAHFSVVSAILQPKLYSSTVKRSISMTADHPRWISWKAIESSAEKGTKRNWKLFWTSFCCRFSVHKLTFKLVRFIFYLYFHQTFLFLSKCIIYTPQSLLGIAGGV